MRTNDEKIALYHAAVNALEHGKARVQSVLGKLHSDDRFKTGGKEAFAIAERSVAAVNGLNRAELEEIVADMGKEAPKVEKSRERGLDPLKIDDGVVTRFPPEPNGYLHIGHAKAAIIGHEYARIYGGRFQLRFDDTNPRNEKFEFYDAQKEDLRWLGIDWDEELRSSADTELFYRYCQRLLKDGSAFVCTCQPQKLRDLRSSREPCPCRSLTSEENLERWQRMFSMEEGGAVVRLRGDLGNDNSVMWDPTLLRIIDHEHPIEGHRYRIWPTYDFAGAVEDSIHGVTHALRSKEYELRDELYFRILDLLDLRKPRLIEFSRLEMEGVDISKRAMKKKVAERGWSWDDPRFPTLGGLKRRGITPQAIRELVLSLGVSKSEAVISWELLYSQNRKVVDPIARRLFFVRDPVMFKVKGAPEGTVRLKNHPSQDMGTRKVAHRGEFYIPADEAARLKNDELVRLKDLYNVRVEKSGSSIGGRYSKEPFDRRTMKIQWVSHEHVDVEVLMVEGDDLGVVKGYGEEAVKNLGDGEIIQFERFGFCRTDGPNRFIYAHR